MKTQILKDGAFEEEYNEKIIPFRRAYEKSEYYGSPDDKKMHFLMYENEKATANVVILHGFTECAEKFSEMAYYFFCEGYNVYAPDLRGHGLSYKDDAPKYAVSCKGFNLYADDVMTFVKNVVCKNGLPVYCYTHSLGATAALLSLMDNTSLPIEKLVLSSPMICGNMGMPVALAKMVSRLVTYIGKGNTPAPKKCVFEPDKDNEDAASIERGRFSLKLKKENENYQTCGPTMEWVMHSIEACEKLLKEENVKRLSAEMLVIKPEKDRQLLESYQDKFISLCKKHKKSVKVISIGDTCHEIFQSKEKALGEYLESIFEFFGSSAVH